MRRKPLENAILAADELAKLYGHDTRYHTKTHSARDKGRIRARVSQAIKSGHIKRLPCERCGFPDAEAAHVDYDRPFDVIFLCERCHDGHDGINREDQR